MSKMSLMARNALKNKVVLNSAFDSKSYFSSRLFPTSFTKAFSTEGTFSPPPRDVDPQGQVFGRVVVTSKNALKTDLIHFFEGCNLSGTDVKVEYNRSYAPISMFVQFPSQAEFDMAQKQTLRKGRLYKLEKVDRSMWESLKSYEGKWSPRKSSSILLQQSLILTVFIVENAHSVLALGTEALKCDIIRNVAAGMPALLLEIFLQGLPRTASPEDVERFLSGCNYDPSFELMLRPFGANNLIKCALVRFETALDAMHAFVTKNNSFCQNNPVRVHLLQ